MNTLNSIKTFVLEHRAAIIDAAAITASVGAVAYAHHAVKNMKVRVDEEIVTVPTDIVED